MLTRTDVLPGYLLCVDPGMRCVGLALFSVDGKLLRAGLVESPIKPPIRGVVAWHGAASAVRASEWGARTPERVIVEDQHANYGRTENPNDLLQCSGSAGALAVLWPEAALSGVLPEVWKGSLPKADMTARIQRRLEESPAELAAVLPCKASLRHNVLDAVGIGLWHFGRLAARRVIAR